MRSLRGDEGRVAGDVFRRPVHDRVEVGGHLEVSPEVLVRGLENAEGSRTADQHDLGAYRNGLGPHGGRGQRRVLLADVLDTDLSAPQDALQRVP